ncbi:MAG: Nramp family divalent metal transporter, partial [Actinomycetota bacterium]
FGPEVRWLFLIGVTIQLAVMMEMARWTMATGESIFFGAARLHRAAMWFFWATALLVYIFPGHIALGAQAIESLTGVPWVPTAIGGLLLIGVILTFSKIVYNVVETVLTTFISILVIGSAIIASMVGTWGDVADTVTGTFAFGFVDSEWFTAAWFPLIIGSLAFAGPSGMQQMWYTLWLRDKGAGMGHYIPRIRGLRGLDEEETMPTRGYTFDTEDPAEMKKWQGWRKWNTFDAAVLFWGITMVTTIIFTVLALSAARLDPNAAGLIRAGDDSATIPAMAAAFGDVGGDFARIAFFAFIGIIGWKLSFGLFDALARGQADMTYYFAPFTRKWSMSRIYLGYVWLIVAAGITTLSLVGLGVMGNEDGPAFILNLLAFLSALAMGAYCVLLLFTNNKLLPKKIRPRPIFNLALGLGALMYLGGLFVSLAVFGALPD